MLLNEIHDKVKNEIINVSGCTSYLDSAVVGSSYINQKYTNDIDVIVLCRGEDGINTLAGDLCGTGWEIGGSFTLEEADTVPRHEHWYISFKKTIEHNGNDYLVNIILMLNAKEFSNFKMAAEICRMLRELHGAWLPKDVRVDIHTMMRYSLDLTQLKSRKERQNETVHQRSSL